MSEHTTFFIQTITGFFLGQAIITEAGKTKIILSPSDLFACGER
jgi:hypothetical protein